MESDSPPSSPTVPLSHAPTQSQPTPIIDSSNSIRLLDNTPTSITSTPLTSSQSSGESLTDFDFRRGNESREDTSDDAPEIFGPLQDSPPSDIPQRPRVVFYTPNEETPEGDSLTDLRDEDFATSTGPPNGMSDDVVLDFFPVEGEEEESTSVEPSPPGPPSLTSSCGSAAVPLELATASRREMSGREKLAIHATALSLPSRAERETTGPPDWLSGSFTAPGDLSLESVAVDKGSPRDYRSLKKVSKDRTTAASAVASAAESLGSQGELGTPLTDLAYRENCVGRPPLRRYKDVVTDEDLGSDYTLSLRESSLEEVPSLEDTFQVQDENFSPNAASSVRAKRYRKKGFGLSLSIDVGDSDTNQAPSPRGKPLPRPQYSFEEGKRKRPTFVDLNVEEGLGGPHFDTWDHSELEENILENMKIEKDFVKCRKARQEHSGDAGTTIINMDETEDRKTSSKRSSDSDVASHDSNGNIKKGFKVKSVLCQVKEETCEVMEEVNNKGLKEMAKKSRDCGHENPAFLDDEQDAVSQEENGSDQSAKDSHMEVSRRRSDPEISVPKPEEIIRSHSYGDELDKVMNDLNSDQQQSAHPAPTLRKRSLSRGRSENQEGGKESSNNEESPPSTTSKKENNVSFGPTFAYSAKNSNSSSTSNVFQKLVGQPIMKLTRSESTKSHMVSKNREEMFSRSISNIWDGGSTSGGRIKGSSGSSSFYGRPPPAPLSLPRDDHRHSHKNYLLQQHLYRNSRRNMQAKLLRQLSDNYFDDHRDHRFHGSDPHHLHHIGRHDKKHDSDHGHGGGHGHHHRSQSQRHLHRPNKHEPLRRLNTYGHEEYHKYVQAHEHRYEQAQFGQGGGGALKPSDGEEAVRRISHYRMEEIGKTDVERWVGVHGDQPTEGNQSSQPLLPSPGTPHIVVSPEESTKNNQNESEPQNFNTPGSNGPVFPNAQSTPAPPPTPATNNADDKRSRPDKLALSMTTLDLPDGVYRKTRRNSINEMHRRFGSTTNLQRSNSVNNIQRSNSRNSLAPSVLDWKQEGNDSLISCLSALYGKLLVVMGMAFPIAEVISHDIPITFYYGFYLFLYIGSIIFLVYAYIFLLHSITIPTETLKSKIHSIRSLMTIPDLSSVFQRNASKQEGKGNLAGKDSRVTGCSDMDKESDRASIATGSYKTPKYTLTESNNHGSMYLKMGAVLFGIGSMIYSGLEVGRYFELRSDENCADILLAIAPAARMLFTFIQMYFIFLNSRVAISRHRVIARFGLMHMIGTNLCIWLNVLVQETKHEIINLTLGPGEHHGGGNTWRKILSGELTAANRHDGAGHHDDSSAILGHHGDGAAVINGSSHEVLNDTLLHNTHDQHDIHQIANDSHHIVKRGSGQQALSIFECRRSDLMGVLVDEASPFLFPCTIEYSLLCAGVLYVIWKNINKPEVAYDGDSDISTYIARKARHHYSVDCAHANRGLFMGILVLVLTIISLILFFVLINNEAYKEVAIMEANIIEISVYGVASVTVVIGMIQMRELEFIPEGDIELDNILLLIAQSGVYIYTSFTVIGGHFTMTDNLILPLLSAIITLVQTTLQTIFILDSSRRCCYNQDQLQRKPGREMVTFLLVCNLAMWAINTFETSRADAHPTQLNFYGIWAWTIISHVSMPLAIFYRFHVTVCLCEIWKRSYKLRNDY